MPQYTAQPAPIVKGVSSFNVVVNNDDGTDVSVRATSSDGQLTFTMARFQGIDARDRAQRLYDNQVTFYRLLGLDV